MPLIPPETRLAILSQFPAVRPWRSCQDHRRCVVCDRVFTGEEVRVRGLRRGRIRLHCPTARCPSTPLMWVHPDNPLISSEAWEDWDRVISALEENESSVEAEALELPALIRPSPAAPLAETRSTRPFGSPPLDDYGFGSAAVLWGLAS